MARKAKKNTFTVTVYTDLDPEPQVYTDVIEWQIVQGSVLSVIVKHPNDRYVICGIPMGIITNYLIEGWRPPVAPLVN